MTTDTQKLLYQATVAAQLGERERAEALFNQVIALEPENVDAWLGLAGVVEDREEKRRIYETILAIAPDHPVAREGLRALQGDGAATPAPEESAAEPSSAQERKDEDTRWPVLRYEDGVPIYACAYHPDRETTLRCNRCGKPICTECAVLTDVGYRCPDCVAELTGRFYHAQPKHVVFALVAAAVLGFLAGVAAVLAVGFIGFWAIFLIMPLAGLVAEGIWRAGARHRARHLNLYASAVVLIFGVLGVIAIAGSLFALRGLLGLLGIVLVVVIVYQRLR